MDKRKKNIGFNGNNVAFLFHPILTFLFISDTMLGLQGACRDEEEKMYVGNLLISRFCQTTDSLHFLHQLLLRRQVKFVLAGKDGRIAFR